MPDSRKFSRTLAATGLIAGPLLFAIGSGIDPAWGDDSGEYLADVADNTGVYTVAGILQTVGSLVFIAGTIGLMRLFRGRRLSLGQIAAGLITIGLIGLTAVLAFNGFDIVLAEADNREAATAIYDDVEDSTAIAVYWITFFIVGIALGNLLLAISLFRRRIVPIWSPILLIVSFVVGFAADNGLLSALSFVLLGAALFPLAMLIWNMSDEQWERWSPLPDRGDEPAPAPAAPPPVEPVRT